MFPKVYLKYEVKREKQREYAEVNCELLILSLIPKLILDRVYTDTVCCCGSRGGDGWILGLAGVDASNN